jgi:hypothetical protein
MLKVDAQELTLTLDLKDKLGLSLADSLVAILWLYLAEDEETKAQLHSLSLMLKGQLPLADYDVSDFINVR